MKAFWTRDVGSVSVTSTTELAAVLDRIRQTGTQTMLFLEASDGSILVAGIGGEESVVLHFDPDGDGSHSIGDLSREGKLNILSQDVMDDFLAEMAVPQPVAIEAVMTFVETGARPTNLEWEAD